jgi:hypothetical protein
MTSVGLGIGIAQSIGKILAVSTECVFPNTLAIKRTSTVFTVRTEFKSPILIYETRKEGE